MKIEKAVEHMLECLQDLLLWHAVRSLSGKVGNGYK